MRVNCHLIITRTQFTLRFQARDNRRRMSKEGILRKQLDRLPLNQILTGGDIS